MSRNPNDSGTTYTKSVVISRTGASVQVTKLELSQESRESLRSKSPGITSAKEDAQWHARDGRAIATP
jgi:hypothetical protein